MGETGDTEVPVPGADDVSLPPRGALGIEKGGEVLVPLAEVELDTVTIVICEFVKVVVRVSGKVIVVAPVVVGSVGAVCKESGKQEMRIPNQWLGFLR